MQCTDNQAVIKDVEIKSKGCCQVCVEAKIGGFYQLLRLYAVAGYYCIGVKDEDMGTPRMQPDVSGEYAASF